MDKELTLKKLEANLAEMKRSNRSLWNSYGSELCAGAMIREEEELEKKIEKLEKEIIQETKLKFAIFDALNPNKMDDNDE